MHPDRLWSVPDAAEWQTAAHDMTVHSKHTRLIHHQYPLSWHTTQCTSPYLWSGSTS